MLDLDEGLAIDVARRKSFWSTMALDKDWVLVLANGTLRGNYASAEQPAAEWARGLR
jgi:hypothetical protein